MTDQQAAACCCAEASNPEQPRDPVSLLHRAPDGCCFVVATDPQHLYCPERRRLRSSYCVQHHAVVWQRSGRPLTSYRPG
jgi:hypothetical protein